jgi:hypothetical protein
MQAIRYHVDNNQKGWLSKLPRIRNHEHSKFIHRILTFPPKNRPVASPHPTSLASASNAEVDAHEIITRLELDVKEAQVNLLAAKIRQAYHANEHRDLQRR